MAVVTAIPMLIAVFLIARVIVLRKRLGQRFFIPLICMVLPLFLIVTLIYGGIESSNRHERMRAHFLEEEKIFPSLIEEYRKKDYKYWKSSISSGYLDVDFKYSDGSEGIMEITVSWEDDSQENIQVLFLRNMGADKGFIIAPDNTKVDIDE